MCKIKLEKILKYFEPNYVIITCLKTLKFCVCITKRDFNNINIFLRCEDFRVF